jgi:hypothetical protein
VGPAAAAAAAAGRRAELRQLKLSQLKKLAAAAGVPGDQIDGVDDDGSPTGAATALVLELEAAAAAAASAQRPAGTRRRDLGGVRVSELRRRAVVAGMNPGQLDSADDSESPRAAFADFLAGKGGDGARSEAAGS